MYLHLNITKISAKSPIKQHINLVSYQILCDQRLRIVVLVPDVDSFHITKTSCIEVKCSLFRCKSRKVALTGNPARRFIGRIYDMRTHHLHDTFIIIHTQGVVQQIAPEVTLHNFSAVEQMVYQGHVKFHNERNVVKDTERKYHVIPVYQYSAGELNRKCGKREPIALPLNFKI